MMPDQLYRRNEKGRYVKVGPSDYHYFNNLASGVWIVQNRVGRTSKSCVAKVCDLPEVPFDFASIMMEHDELASFMQKYDKEYYEKHKLGCSYWEMSKAVLIYLAKKSGNLKTRKKTSGRRIDLTL